MKKFVYVTFRFNFILNILLENPNMNIRKIIFKSVIDRRRYRRYKVYTNNENIFPFRYLKYYWKYLKHLKRGFGDLKKHKKIYVIRQPKHMRFLNIEIK